MFGGEDTLFEGLWSVAREDGHFGLPEHFAGIQLLRYNVNRAAADLIARLQRARMGVETSILGK
jgi:hypothetical protein